MIPQHISHKDLSLNLGYPTNTVEFNFVIGNDGEIYSKSVGRKRIKVTDKLTPKEASVLVNYYVGHEAEFAIYRVGGKYADKSDIDCYTHSVTAIRRFVSNINLTFFLEQNGVTNFPEKDLASIQNNKDEIISHLNETDELQKFTNTNRSFVKKYIRIVKLNLKCTIKCITTQNVYFHKKMHIF